MSKSRSKRADARRIVVEPDGAYRVEGDIPLVQKAPVVSEFGEPMTWLRGETIPTEGEYRLCRCGQSRDKPFCDDTHLRTGFDGTEAADTGPTAARQIVHEGGVGIAVKRDHSLCMDAGFCGTRFAKIQQLVRTTGEPIARAQVMAMIERCPSGSLTYTLQPGGQAVEPDLPQQIAVTTEMTSSGPIVGPLWVTGNIPIERADGEPFETRNRVTLCRCGQSQTKPLCDGSHREQLIRC